MKLETFFCLLLLFTFFQERTRVVSFCLPAFLPILSANNFFARCSAGRPVAPYNTTQFIMAEHDPYEADDLGTRPAPPWKRAMLCLLPANNFAGNAARSCLCRAWLPGAEQTAAAGCKRSWWVFSVSAFIFGSALRQSEHKVVLEDPRNRVALASACCRPWRL